MRVALLGNWCFLPLLDGSRASGDGAMEGGKAFEDWGEALPRRVSLAFLLKVVEIIFMLARFIFILGSLNSCC